MNIVATTVGTGPYHSAIMLQETLFVHEAEFVHQSIAFDMADTVVNSINYSARKAIGAAGFKLKKTESEVTLKELAEKLGPMYTEENLKLLLASLL